MPCRIGDRRTDRGPTQFGKGLAEVVRPADGSMIRPESSRITIRLQVADPEAPRTRAGVTNTIRDYVNGSNMVNSSGADSIRFQDSTEYFTSVPKRLVRGEVASR